MSVPHKIPDLPSLPPLVMPSFPDATLTSPPSPDKVPSHVRQSPSLSVADSFSTAYTSAIPPDGLEETNHLGSSSLGLSQSLRKSVSVDSFAQCTGDESRSGPGDPSAGPSRNLVYGIPFEVQAESTIPAWSSRSRGQSLSSIQRDYEPPFRPDFDVDRYDPLSLSRIERFRRQSLKSPEAPTPSVRAGDLTLPARTTTMNAPSLRERGDLPSVSSTSSLQSTSRRSNPFVPHPAGRLRSGSLGYNMPAKRTVVNPHIPLVARQSTSSMSVLALLVIGTKGCGKSTVIKKGLSKFGLAVVSDTSSSESSGANRIRYLRRTGNILLDQQPESPGGTPHALDVLEVEAQTTNDALLKWLEGLHTIDGVIICFDYSDISSCQPIEGLLKHYRSTTVPVMVLGCKSDLKHEVDANDVVDVKDVVDPNDVVEMLRRYETGLIEVSNANDGGKDKMKRTFRYLLNVILRQRGPQPMVDNRNPATPSILISDNSAPTPITSSSIPSFNNTSSMAENASDTSELSTSLPNTDSTSPASPDEYQSTGDLAYSTDASQTHGDTQEYDVHDSDDAHHNDSADNSPSLPVNVEPTPRESKKAKKEPRPSQWADLEELLDKLLFLAVSGDDPTFATHFLLTYRRFTTPRSVLLAMQKRMRQLDNPSGDPMFACFAQMRICHLLETWIHDYAHDFAVKGTAGALTALIKSIISKTHLLHYGSEFLPFLEQLPSLVDEDTAWAKKADISDADSDDYTVEEEDPRTEEVTTPETSSVEVPSSSPQIAFPPPRERTASFPLPRARLSVSQSNVNYSTIAEQQSRQYIKELFRIATEVMNTDSEEIAQEITRQGQLLFMVIKPRDWLNFTFVSKKLPDEPISAFNAKSSQIADWVVTLILCHDRPRNRARQIEKFIDIAVKLRNLNNYSALRAFVAGINNANDDATMEVFKSKYPDHAKNLRSWDVLLQQSRAHRAYRLALRNSKGACIPAMEVHISDLIKAHEGNDDLNPAFPSKIHWGKFNMMGKFVTTTVQCQNQCRNSEDYNFPQRPLIAALLDKCPLMITEIQKSRLKSQDDYDEAQPVVPVSQPLNLTGMRRMFFW